MTSSSRQLWRKSPKTSARQSSLPGVFPHTNHKAADVRAESLQIINSPSWITFAKPVTRLFAHTPRRQLPTVPPAELPIMLRSYRPYATLLPTTYPHRKGVVLTTQLRMNTFLAQRVSNAPHNQQAIFTTNMRFILFLLRKIRTPARFRESKENKSPGAETNFRINKSVAQRKASHRRSLRTFHFCYAFKAPDNDDTVVECERL